MSTVPVSTVPVGPGPYAPTTAGLGGLPTLSVDVPVTSVFLALFICGAAGHMTTLQLNRIKKHKFILSGALFGFCMARSVACILRIVWANENTSIRIAIAANVFFNAGVIIIIIINLIFTQRIIRAQHPAIGWSRVIHFIFLAVFASIPALLIMLIVAIIQQIYTLDPTILSHDQIIQRLGVTWFAVFAFLPIPLVLLSTLLMILKKPPHDPEDAIAESEEFGTGEFTAKSSISILLLGATLICLGASFRAAAIYMPRPVNDPAWYHSKAAYYCFDFMIEVIVVYLYLFTNVDRRFWVPNGSSKVKTYRRSQAASTETSFVVRRRDGEEREMSVIEAKNNV